MREAFLLKNQSFMSLFFLSAFGHVAFALSGGSFFYLHPEGGVRQAPSSMEVVLTKVEKKIEIPQCNPEVLLAIHPVDKTTAVVENETKAKKKNEDSSNVVVEEGALQDKAVPFQDNPAPVYPEWARERGWEGRVILSVFVEKTGHPSQVMVAQSSGKKILDDAACNAVRKWKFRPAQVASFSFSTWVRIPIRFSLLES